MDEKQLEHLIADMRRAAAHAGDFIRSQVGMVADNDIESKERNSLVSYVDKRAEEMLVESLSPLVPSPGYITEEATVDNRRSAYTWIIDPLDGTTNFLQQIPVFSVSVALAHHDKIIAGCVYDVMQDDSYHAFHGGGAWCNDQRIRVSNTRTLRESVIATGFPYFEPDALERLAMLFKDVLTSTRAVRRLGSAALDMAYVACGRFDAFYETTLNPWDIAAGTILVREAGGEVTDFASKANFVVQREIIASNGQIHDGIADLISRHQLV